MIVAAKFLCPRRHFPSLEAAAAEENIRVGFEAAERAFSISPLMTAEELSAAAEPDALSMVMYLSQFYQLLRDSPPPAGQRPHDHLTAVLMTSPES